MSEYQPESDPFASIKPDIVDDKPSAALCNRLHTRDDVDTDRAAHHHTLGAKENQASPGKHSHLASDGSNKLGTGLNLSISGAKGSAASEDSLVTLLKTFIEFTDNRV